MRQRAFTFFFSILILFLICLSSNPLHAEKKRRREGDYVKVCREARSTGIWKECLSRLEAAAIKDPDSEEIGFHRAAAIALDQKSAGDLKLNQNALAHLNRSATILESIYAPRPTDDLAAIQTHPDLSLRYFYRGLIHRALKDAILANADFARARRITPSLWEAGYNEAILLFALGKPTEARTILEEIKPARALGEAINRGYGR